MVVTGQKNMHQGAAIANKMASVTEVSQYSKRG